MSFASLRSWPALKDLPAPIRTTTRTSLSFSIRARASNSSPLSARLSAFSTRGRLSVITAMLPCRSTMMFAYTTFLPSAPELVPRLLEIPAAVDRAWQLVLANALARRLRELVDEGDVARHLEIGEARFAPSDHVERIHGRTVRRTYEELDLVVGQLGRDTDDRTLLHAPATAHGPLDLPGRNVLAPAPDAVLPSAREIEESFGVPIADVSRVEPSIPQCSARAFRIPEVALHQEAGRPFALDDLSVLTVGHRPVVVVHDPDLEVLDRCSDRSHLSRQIGGREARALGEAVAFVDTHAEASLETGPHVGRSGGAPGNAPRGLRVVGAHRQLHEEPEDSGEIVDLRRAVASDLIPERGGTESLHERERDTVLETQGHGLHAGDVIERLPEEEQVSGPHVGHERRRSPCRLVHRIAEHHALRRPCRPGRIHDRDDVIRIG